MIGGEEKREDECVLRNKRREKNKERGGMKCMMCGVLASDEQRLLNKRRFLRSAVFRLSK